MPKSGRFHPVFEGETPPPPTCRFPTFAQSGKIHSNVHDIFTELVLGSFPEILTYTYIQVRCLLDQTRSHLTAQDRIELPDGCGVGCHKNSEYAETRINTRFSWGVTNFRGCHKCRHKKSEYAETRINTRFGGVSPMAQIEYTPYTQNLH